MQLPNPADEGPGAIGWRHARSVLLAILAVSAALRFVICAEGGQYFFGDESRYDRGVQLYGAVTQGDWHAARGILALPEHAAFPWVGALVTAAQGQAARATPYGAWREHPEQVGFTMWLGACFLSLFSTANILLVYAVARAAGAGREEALWAVLLMAVSNTSFYYARHLLPYDCALFFALLALAIGLRRGDRPGAFACGFLACFAYHIYNGYWYLPPTLACVFALAWRERPQWGGRCLACALGGVLGLGVPLLVGTMAGGASYWRMLAAFSRFVTQGIFSEGWSLPWEFLWHSEGLAGIAVAVCIAAALGAAALGSGVDSRMRLWLSAAGAAYALLVLMSVGLSVFVVYARTVKPLVPLLCLMGGWSLVRLTSGRPWLKAAGAAAFVASGILMALPHVSRVFPREVEIAILRAQGNPKHTLSVSGSIYIPLTIPVTRPDLALVNAQLLYPIRGYIGFPAGETLLRLENPLSYEPFQYEGHTPRERQLLRTRDISIQLVRLSNPAGVPDDLPWAERFQNAERPTGR
jgi:hypothetical protein